MKKFRIPIAALALSLCVVAVAPEALARGWDAAVIPVASVATSAGVAGSFTLTGSGYYHLQCTVPYYEGAAESSITCTSTTCKYHDANTTAYIEVGLTFRRIGYLTPTAGTCNLFRAIPN